MFIPHFKPILGKKKGKTEVLPYMSNNYDHYSAGVASSVAAGALLRRVFLAGSAAVAIELP